MSVTMNRRHFLKTMSAGLGLALAAPYVSFASAATDQRFILIIQRGAADGLNTVIPYADPAYAPLRGALAIDVRQASKLDGMFALHPALAESAAMYRQGEALFVHAVASPYRDRSHFDAQNILETGGSSPYQLKDGWLNRLLTLLPPAKNEAIAIASTIPMALRGKMDVASYAPSTLPQASDDLLMRVSQLYARDSQLHKAWAAAMDIKQTAEDSKKQDAATLGKLAASLLVQADGPRIAMIETGGWDTHSAQEPRLNKQLKSLDEIIANIRTELGAVWQKTTIMVITEFGRTAAANGTGGTDHGTGAVAMLFGGDILGGRVMADWPGLKQSALYEGRDLNPTLNLNALISTTIAQRFSLDEKQVGQVLFPESSFKQPIAKLLRS